jgi:indolepyruvate ferredoxin oxidoreductase alpha subunit
MAERSFAKEIEKLRLGEGEEFQGEGILAVTKALLQSGISYVGGYQGAPVSHLMDVLADAHDILEELDVNFESSASEASAAAMLAASINYPIRGAVTWKSTVGTNVASDALSNIASAGVKGGALIILGEDYGEGASIMQERTHAFAMKSQIWLLDPRPNLKTMTDMIEHSFRLSEFSKTPVMYQMRIRACHMHGRFTVKDNRKGKFSCKDALDNPVGAGDAIILPPHTFRHEQEKIHERWPAAIDYIQREKLNEFMPGSKNETIGIITLGGHYNGVVRALQNLNLSDSFGDSAIPLYVMNVSYPLVDKEVIDFCRDKEAVLIIEEGQPDFIEQNLHSILRKAELETKLYGKDVLLKAGEYTGAVLKRGIKAFVEQSQPHLIALEKPIIQDIKISTKDISDTIPVRPPGLCTGCPERPFFTAIKLFQREVGPLQISADIGCHSFATLPPFNLGNTIVGYGLGAASSSAFNQKHKNRPISLMGDGGFWHNGLTSGIGNSVENVHDGITVVIDNGYSAATGGQWIPSSKAVANSRQYKIPIIDAIRGMGVSWIRKTNTYDIKQSLQALRDAMKTDHVGPKVIIAEGECTLNKTRREKPIIVNNIKKGKRVVQQKFGIDDDLCTGDHSCIRLSGCPSLSIADNPDPLRDDPVAKVEESCVGCGVCGEIAHAAVLCPSFFRVDSVRNPSRFERFTYSISQKIISFLQNGSERKRELLMSSDKL